MSEEQPDPAAATAIEPLPRRPSITCPGCGAPIDGDQGWCTECGLAARTRIAETPNWRLPIILAGALALGAVVALIVAFVVLTGDNAPLPETTPTAAAPADTVPTTSVPVATTPTAPVATTPVTTTPTVPAATTPVVPTPTATVPTATTTTPTTPGTSTTLTTPGGAEAPAPVPND